MTSPQGLEQASAHLKAAHASIKQALHFAIENPATDPATVVGADIRDLLFTAGATLASVQYQHERQKEHT